MYSTCIFCHQDLGQNESIEEFPVGRRLAFDSDLGRLWVVCKRCERWNLSPLDTRWEAIEACEKAYHDTRLRVSSDNIGLAKLADGLELVRVGNPLRQEFAAWRYGDQFGRRRKRALVATGVGGVAVGAVAVGGALAGLSIGGLFPAGQQAFLRWYRSRTLHRLLDADGNPIQVQRKHLFTSRLVASNQAEEGWELQVDHIPGWERRRRSRRRFVPVEGSGWEMRGRDWARRTLVVSGPDAVKLAGQLMAHANRRGGKKRTVSRAVSRIEAAGHPDTFLPLAAKQSEALFNEAVSSNRKVQKQMRKQEIQSAISGSLQGMPDEMRLAVEMATQEQSEREALEGELKGLELMWRRAEEIAHIADNLFLPESIETFIAQERERLVVGDTPKDG